MKDQRTEFQSPLSPDNLLHTILKDIKNMVVENKREAFKAFEATNTKIEKIAEDVAEVRSTVDKLAIDHIMGTIQEVKAENKGLDVRLKVVESYHQKILGIIAFVGFGLAVLLTVYQVFFADKN